MSVVERVCGLTSELTRRRESNQASPDESSYETRPRRSRPTICYADDERVRAGHSLRRISVNLWNSELIKGGSSLRPLRNS